MLGGPPAGEAGIGGAFKIGESDCLVGKPIGGCVVSTIAFLFYHIYFFARFFHPGYARNYKTFFVFWQLARFCVRIIFSVRSDH